MCRVVYIAADRPLPLIPWNPESPEFHVIELTDREAPVKSQFSKTFVYYAGSHQGCGCAYDLASMSIGHPEELPDARRSREALVRYLREVLDVAGPLELYTCWDGDWTDPAVQRTTVDPSALLPEEPWLPERTFAIVTGASGRRNVG